MIEHFKPAGHKAPNREVAVALEESFPPIQRVVHNNKTIGYLYRELEYYNGCVDDLVLAKEMFQDINQNTIYYTCAKWQQHLSNDRNNPYGFHIPSGPLMMELTYRTEQTKSKIHNEVKNILKQTYNQGPALNTIIDHAKKKVQHTHLNNETITQSLIQPEHDEIVLSEDIDVTTQSYLTTILGRRALHTNAIFSTYATPVILLTQPKHNPREKHALLLAMNDQAYINACGFISNRPARGVALAERILNMPGVEVHDV